MTLTSNRAFAAWGEIFSDPVVATALLDRLLHHAVVVQIQGALSAPPRFDQKMCGVKILRSRWLQKIYHVHGNLQALLQVHAVRRLYSP